MKILEADRKMLDVHEYETRKFCAEASTLGLKPGDWPRTIETDMGNGMIFIAQHKEVRDGDLLWVDYFQANGCITLKIFND